MDDQNIEPRFDPLDPQHLEAEAPGLYALLEKALRDGVAKTQSKATFAEAREVLPDPAGGFYSYRDTIISIGYQIQ